MANPTSSVPASPRRQVNIAILVAALGYFVDVYDIVLFSIVRVASLKSFDLNEEQILGDGVFLLNCQMIGMLIGGVIWGIFGDKRGRIQVLFGSILLYSFANILNAFVSTVPQYAMLRFLAGLGLAGEIGAGITLVSELMSKEKRGFGTTIVATVGVSGAVVAGLVGDLFPWRTAYVIGGVMGLALLVLRVSVHESGLFQTLKSEDTVARGDLTLLCSSKERVIRYLSCIVIGMPIWCVVGIVMTFSPEIGQGLGIVGKLTVRDSILWCYVGLTLGDLASGLLSQFWQSRKKAVFLFLGMTFVFSMIILNLRGQSTTAFYATCVPLGFFVGYWAVFVTTAAEQFGTNLRATVATTVPNFVRGSTVLMTLLFKSLKDSVGVVESAGIVCFLTCAFAALALWHMRETYGSDLNFVETR